MSGLTPATSGEIIVNGDTVTKPDPDSGVVYQTIALFPWMTVMGNVSFGLKMRGVPKKERVERQTKEYEAQQIEIEKLQTYVDKNLARASTSNSAKSRIKALDSMELIEKPEGDIKPIHLKFETTKESYKDVLTISDMSLAVGEEKKVLCEHLDLAIKRGEKIAIIGENGIGKSTLLKTVQGIIPQYEGDYDWGKNVSISYYEQENLNLHPEKLAIDELWDRFPHIPEAQIRRVLGNVRLSRDDVFKPVKVISGGERAKLAFCILMLEKSNVMILDEPTNHLDLPSKEVLEHALTEYDGTLLFVTHDRYLLNKIPDKIVEMTKDGAIIYDGNYDYYVERQQFLNSSAVAAEKPVVTKSSGGSYRSKEQRRAEVQKKARIKELEEEITWLEKEIGILQDELADGFCAEIRVRVLLCHEYPSFKILYTLSPMNTPYCSIVRLPETTSPVSTSRIGAFSSISQLFP